LRRQEFVTERAEFAFFDVAGLRQQLRLKAGELAFTYCQVPVIFRRARKTSLAVVRADGSRRSVETPCLDAATSREIFERTGKVARIEVCLGP
jgi:hypothetical protein